MDVCVNMVYVYSVYSYAKGVLLLSVVPVQLIAQSILVSVLKLRADL